jgi:branched-chain amino acid transport system substrate-binding protein
MSTKKEWTQPIGYKHAAYEISADVLRRAGSVDKVALKKAIADTRIDTIVGPIQYNEQHYSRTPLVGGQWVKGKKFPWELKLVYNKEHPNIPLTGKMMPIP